MFHQALESTLARRPPASSIDTQPPPSPSCGSKKFKPAKGSNITAGVLILFARKMRLPYQITGIMAVLVPSRFAIVRLDPSHDYAVKLLAPNWQPVEDHFGNVVPEVLKRFYADPKNVLLTDFDIVSRLSKIPGRIHVQFFEAIGESSVDGFFEGFENLLSFASDGGGGRYVIDISEPNPKVHYHIYDIGHDPERFRFTGLSLSEFLSAKRIKGNG